MLRIGVCMICVVTYITVWALISDMNTYQGGGAEPTNGEIIPKLAK